MDDNNSLPEEFKQRLVFAQDDNPKFDITLPNKPPSACKSPLQFGHLPAFLQPEQTDEFLPSFP